MVGADDARFDDSHRAGRNARRGPAGTIRTRALDRLAPQRINAPWGEHRVDEQRLVAARALDIGGKAVIEESAERIHLVLCDGQPRRHRMAAARDEQSRRSEEHTSELQSLMRISSAVFCLNQTTTTLH